MYTNKQSNTHTAAITEEERKKERRESKNCYRVVLLFFTYDVYSYSVVNWIWNVLQALNFFVAAYFFLYFNEKIVPSYLFNFRREKKPFCKSFQLASYFEAFILTLLIVSWGFIKNTKYFQSHWRFIRKKIMLFKLIGFCALVAVCSAEKVIMDFFTITILKINQFTLSISHSFCRWEYDSF